MNMYSSTVTKVDNDAANRKLDRGFEGELGDTKDYERKNLSGKQLLEEITSIKKLLPFDSTLLGKKLEFEKPKKKRKLKKAKYDLNRFRVEINSIAQRNGVCSSREEINKAVENHPWNVELRALHAILIFNDIQQGADNSNKLEIIRDSVVELALAMYNGAISVFNTTWFVKIYFAYLSGLNSKIKRTVYFCKESQDNSSIKAFREVEAIQKQFHTLMTIRDMTRPHQRLRSVVSSTSYLTNPVTIEEYKQASAALLTGDIKRKIGMKRADFILYIYNTTMQLFSRIPVLERMVKDFTEQIPGVHRDLILQKQMINHNIMATQFQIAKYGMDMGKARGLSSNLLGDCNRTIHEFLETSNLSKMYESDPFLRVGWVVKESKEIGFENYHYKKLLLQAQEYLETILGPRCDSVSASMRARGYIFHIKAMLTPS